MEAHEVNLAEFIGDKKTLVIPVYQRKYDWQQEHCQQLFSDIKKIIETDKSHFLGTLVYQEKTSAGIFSEYIIIDGQQRITSVILFAKALCESDSSVILKIIFWKM